MKTPFSIIMAFVSMSLSQSRAAVDKNSSYQKVTSVYLSETFINEQLKAHVKPGLLNDMSIVLDVKNNQIFLKGLLQIPVEELRAINLDPKLGAFRFQLTVRPETTPEGYLILEFPLNETYFYPASSKDIEHDRVIVPVQMLSLALASVRGYFAALSGDFSGFDRRTAKLKAMVKALDRAIYSEKNQDAVDALKTERESLKLQLAAIPIERKQLKNLSKEVEGLLGFTGEKELNLNDQFAARQNALIIKLNLEKLTPYLTGVELGGIRILHDHADGPRGENYFSIDIKANEATSSLSHLVKEKSDQDGLEQPPSAMIRINQALFESELILKAEQKSLGSKIENFKIELKDDGVHVTGKYHKFFFTIPFDAIVDLETIKDDVFNIAVRDVKISGIDLEFLSGFVLEALKNRLDNSLKGICHFEYIGEQKDHSRALQVTVEPKKLIPALADLHIIDVDVRENEFLFKVGK